MIGPATIVGLIGASVCVAAFIGLLALLVAGWKRSPQIWLFALACVATVAWASAAVYQGAAGVELPRLSLVFGVLQLASWIVVLLSFLDPRAKGPLGSPTGRLALRGAGLAVIAWIVIVGVQPWGQSGVVTIHLIAQLAISIAGLSLIETILRNASQDERWRVKFFGIGLGAVFVFHMLIAADALLFSGVRLILNEAAGAIYALVAPLLALSIRRFEDWSPQVSVSRKAAFYASTLTASGLYLCAMAVAAFYVREVGGDWGGVIQAIFLFGSVILLVVILASGSVQARLKVFVRKHFFHYKYDYREEWLRFTETVSAGDPNEPLERRVVKAIADILDSPGGALWLRDDTLLSVVATLNMPASSLPTREADEFIAFLETRQWIVDLADLKANPEKYDGITLPDQLRDAPHAWAIVPLLREAHLLGFVLLNEPRAPKTLDWEDFDILRAVGRQAASYLAEQRAARHLAEFNEFHKFNRRFAFVLHDIKNVVSQFSLIASNVERHGHKAEFREDMVATIRDANAQMTRLIERIRSEKGAEPRPAAVVSLPALLSKLSDTASAESTALTLELDQKDAEIVGDADRVQAILRHLTQNALEAAGPSGQVRISLHTREDAAIVEITDNGPGMDDAYIRNELFRPFRSSKKSGFGIGVYQCRDHAREMGGDIEVISSPGAGTTMRVTLPLAHARPPAPAQALSG